MGRSYRITSEDYHFSLADKEWFSPDASNEELVARLDTEIEWDRETAFRLILKSEDSQGLDGLRSIVLESAYPLSRVRALWLLHHKDMMTDDILFHAPKDDESGIREEASFLAELRVSENDTNQKTIIHARAGPY